MAHLAIVFQVVAVPLLICHVILLGVDFFLSPLNLYALVNQNKREEEMKNKQLIILVTLSFLLIFGFSVQAGAGTTYNMGLSLAITGPTSDAGNPYSK